MHYLRSAVWSVILLCGALTGTAAASGPWPVEGCGRVFVESVSTNRVVLSDESGLILGFCPSPGGSWHLLPGGQYGVGILGGAAVSFVVSNGVSYWVVVGDSGWVSVFGVREDAVSSIQSYWFYAGFTFVFSVGLLGLGVRWFSRSAVAGGVHGLNE